MVWTLNVWLAFVRFLAPCPHLGVCLYIRARNVLTERVLCRYHSDATLKTMKAYRIARKQDGPWINMTPPIRGGIYRKLEVASSSASSEPAGSDTDDDGLDTADDGSTPISDRSSFTSDSSSLNSIKEKVLKETLIKRRAHGHAEDATGKEPLAPASISLSPAAYTDLLMQQEIDDGIKEFPSLDPLVQQDVVDRYRELHERVRNEGFYDCPYIEYGKEMIRYSILFAGFLVALKYGWYMTSAILLGFFWQQIMFSAHDAGRK
jgi:delta8-fatty-acid desaturase